MLQGNAGDRNIPGYVFNRGIKDKPGILPSLIKSASNASVATNALNHPFPPKRRWVVFCLLRRSPNPQKHRINPAATRFCKSLFLKGIKGELQFFGVFLFQIESCISCCVESGLDTRAVNDCYIAESYI